VALVNSPSAEDRPKNRPGRIPCPHRVFSDIAEAERWVRAQVGRDERRAGSR
jgi:hypothetical protein